MNLQYPVSLLLFLPALAMAEVTSFQTGCSEFFATPGGQTILPTIFTGPHYKQICQIHKNRYEFATLYDTSRRIPVYSAYKYYGNNKCSRKNYWLIEPQLDDPKGNKEMAPESTVKKPPLGDNQALNKDYFKTGYDKGHLYPVFQVLKQCTADATFTLTNAAPQDPHFNRGPWKKLERTIAVTLDTQCKHYTNFVVTGVVPRNGQQQHRVNIPTHFWSAYCCLDNNFKPMLSGGFIGTNDNKAQNITQLTMQTIDTTLSDNNHYGKTFSVFGGRC